MIFLNYEGESQFTESTVLSNAQLKAAITTQTSWTTTSCYTSLGGPPL